MITPIRSGPKAARWAMPMTRVTSKRWARRAGSPSTQWSSSSIGTSRAWPRAIGLIDMNTTHRSSRQTNVAGISPSMIRVNTVGMGPDPRRRCARAPAYSRAVTGPPTTDRAVPGEVDTVLTVPNLFTLLRLLCLPLFLYLLIGRDDPAAAGWLLGGLGATDWVDGYLARRLGQVSEFGKKFDPTVDRLLFIVALLGIIAADAAPRWFCIAVLVREVAVGVTIAVATLAFHMTRFDVTWLGKTATCLLMFAIPGFLLGGSDFPGHQAFNAAAWILGIPGLALSYWTAVGYVPEIRRGI